MLHWEWVDPPWELPYYIGDLAQVLQDTQAWIVCDGIIKNMVVVAPPTLPQPLASSDSESKVGVSDKELPSPQQLVSKV